ncbi:type II secretion system F family protein [Kineococcus sp. LSe6-4]|uniref:Type II secretion system F family protein n=1 Tax=Kineococcus halophytocola TaxID=3234027 RepID=A0ABV4H1R9_9ACTN
MSGVVAGLGPQGACVVVAVLLAAAVLVPGGGAGGAGGPAGRGRGAAGRAPGPVLRRVRARVRAPDPAQAAPVADAALVADLLATAVTAGLPPGRALAAVLDALGAEGFAAEPVLQRAAARLSWGSGHDGPGQVFAEDPGRWDDVADPLLLSARTGAPVADLLRSAAASGRDRRRWEAQAAAARLSASLVLPLGVCTLPAFLLLGVVPVVLSLAGDVLG